jgi:hypothetical protein
MWIAFNDAFVSIVALRDQPGYVAVRARRKAHLKRFADARDIVETTDTDYRFRTHLPVGQAGAIVMAAVENIDYANFKNSTKDDDLHRMYSLWWSDHLKLQPSGGKRKPSKLQPKHGKEPA